eukprot:SAG11_NODE_33188_length_278_cov_2.385475_1_plen_41_part_01
MLSEQGTSDSYATVVSDGISAEKGMTDSSAESDLKPNNVMR